MEDLDRDAQLLERQRHLGADVGLGWVNRGYGEMAALVIRLL